VNGSSKLRSQSGLGASATPSGAEPTTSEMTNGGVAECGPRRALADLTQSPAGKLFFRCSGGQRCGFEGPNTSTPYGTVGRLPVLGAPCGLSRPSGTSARTKAQPLRAQSRSLLLVEHEFRIHDDLRFGDLLRFGTQ